MQGSFALHNAARQAMRTAGIMGPSEQHPQSLVLSDGTYLPPPAAGSKRQLEQTQDGQAVLLGVNWITSFFGTGSPAATDVSANFTQIFNFIKKISIKEYGKDPPSIKNVIKLVDLLNNDDRTHLNRLLPVYAFYNTLLLGLCNHVMQGDFQENPNLFTYPPDFVLTKPSGIDVSVLNTSGATMEEIAANMYKLMDEKHARMYHLFSTKIYEYNLEQMHSQLISRIIFYLSEMLNKRAEGADDAQKVYYNWSRNCRNLYPNEILPDNRPKPSLEEDKYSLNYPEDTSKGWYAGTGFVMIGPYFVSLQVILHLLRFRQLDTLSSRDLGSLVKMVHSNGTVELASWFMVTTCIYKKDYWYDSLGLLGAWSRLRKNLKDVREVTSLTEDEENDLTGRLAKHVLSAVGLQLLDLEIPLNKFYLRSLDDPCQWVEGLWNLTPLIRMSQNQDKIFPRGELATYEQIFLTKARARAPPPPLPCLSLQLPTIA